MLIFFRLFCFLSCALPALAQPTVYVTPFGAGNGSGTSWSNALSGTLLAGSVSTATPGTQFWVAAGTYKPTTTADRTASFSIASGVSIYGGFWGTETTFEQRTDYADIVFFSGDIGITGYIEDNSTHVVSLVNTEQTVTIDRITVYGGYKASSDYGSLGAGIYVEPNANGLTLAVNNCRFDANVVEGSLAGGGAIGAVLRNNGRCAIRITGSYFANNSAESGGAFSSITQDGYASLFFDECLFSANYGTFGGAVYVTSGTTLFDSLTINSCRFIANAATNSGGAILFTSRNAVIKNSLFRANTTNGNGGAINASSSVSSYVSSVFDGNSATNGGAIFSSSSSRETKQTFTNCNFVNNSASRAGGAFYNLMLDESVTSTHLLRLNYTTLKNCIVWKNTASDSPFFKNQSVLLSVGAQVTNYPFVTYSLIQDLDSAYVRGTNNGSADPLFVDDVNGNFRLQSSSPAINAGDLSTADLPATDLAGQVRVQDGRVDIGAYEFSCSAVNCAPISVLRRYEKSPSTR